MLMTETQAYNRLAHYDMLAFQRGVHVAKLGPSELTITRLNKMTLEYRWGKAWASKKTAMDAIRTYGQEYR